MLRDPDDLIPLDPRLSGRYRPTGDLAPSSPEPALAGREWSGRQAGAGAHLIALLAFVALLAMGVLAVVSLAAILCLLVVVGLPHYQKRGCTRLYRSRQFPLPKDDPYMALSTEAERREEEGYDASRTL